VQGKTPEQVLKIATQIIKHGADLLATRANEEIYKCVSQNLKRPDIMMWPGTIVIKNSRSKKKNGPDINCNCRHLRHSCC
jgi:NCAIR mutase (PurE)-related protein